MRNLLLLLVLAGSLAAQKKPVTLEALNSQRMPAFGAGAPIWAPDGKRFVYFQGRDLWLYDVSSGKKRQLGPLAPLEAEAVKPPAPEAFPFQNRRVMEQPVQWSSDGRRLLITAGGDLFLFLVEAGGATQLTATPEREADAKLSPDGRKVSFRRDHDLWVMDLASRKEIRLTHDGSPTLLNGELDWVYPEELDLGTAYWWSPDSRSIAYLQFDVSREPVYPQTDLTGRRARFEPERYPQSGEPNADVRLGVVPVEGGRATWLDLGQTRDSLRARFYWLPDSSGLAVMRLNRIQNRLDLLVADAKSGDSRILLKESDPRWVNIRGDLRWLKGGKEFLWESERDGFNHLYRYANDGRLIGQLTRGQWEVTDVACVDEPAGQVYYVSTDPSPLERQFYRVPLEGGEGKRLTEAAGSHNVSMSPGCEYYLDSFSSLTSPPRSVLYRKDGTQVTVWREADRKPLEQYDMLPSEIVRLKAADGTPLYGRLIKPAGFEAGRKYPVIVNVYGGPHAQTVRNAWTGPLSLEQVFAQHGYAVWMLDNRGSFGRGHQFESVVYHNLGTTELEDQKEGIRYLVSQGWADPKRIGIQGWSYGGYMTLFSLLHAPEVFACGVAGAPVTDWHNYDTIYTERYMGLPSENAEGYRRSSNVLAASGLKGKLLIAHNLEDDNVLFQNTVQMADALERAGRLFTMVTYVNKSHGLSMQGRRHFNETMLSFFDGCLK